MTRFAQLKNMLLKDRATLAGFFASCMAFGLFSGSGLIAEDVASVMTKTMSAPTSQRVVSAFAYAENVDNQFFPTDMPCGSLINFNSINFYNVNCSTGSTFVIQNEGVYLVQYGVNVETIIGVGANSFIDPAVMSVLYNGNKVGKTALHFVADGSKKNSGFYSGSGTTILQLASGDTLGLTVSSSAQNDKGKFRLAKPGNKVADGTRKAFLSIVRIR